MEKVLPVQIIPLCIRKLRALRPDENITGFDAWDDFLTVKKSKNHLDEKFILEMFELMKPLKDLEFSDSAYFMRRWKSAKLPSDQMLIHYLVLLDNYCCIHPRCEKLESRAYYSLWSEQLLRSFSADERLLIHWFLAALSKNKYPRWPYKLLEIFVKASDWLPICWRRWYFTLSWPFMELVPLPAGDSRKVYRSDRRGDFDRYGSFRKEKLPPEVAEAIAMDSPEAAEISLTLSGIRWTPGIFSVACQQSAMKILRHMIRKLSPDAKHFSLYDAVIHVMVYAGRRQPFSPEEVLLICEEEHPGALAQYHDRSGNQLFRFAMRTADDDPESARKMRDILMQSGCNPDEPNALGISFRNYSYYLIGKI